MKIRKMQRSMDLITFSISISRLQDINFVNFLKKIVEVSYCTHDNILVVLLHNFYTRSKISDKVLDRR